MSVILDALRRRRRESQRTESSTRGIPAGLGLASAVSTVSRQRDRRLKQLGLAVLVVVTGLWLVLRFSPNGVVNPSAPARDTASGSVAAAHDSRTGTRDSMPPVAEAPGARTPSPEPRVPNPEPRTLNPESRVPVPGPRASNPKSRIPNPEPRVDHFALALRLQDAGDFDGAREHYLAELREGELNVEAHNNLGLLYYDRGMASQAIDEFRRAVQIDPRYVKARSNLAVVLTSAGRLPDARAELHAALDVDPRNADVLVNLALVEKADRRSEQAVEFLLQAVGKEPRHAAAHYNLAVLYDERDSLALAVDHYSAFLKYAGSEHGTLRQEVERRIRTIELRLQTATN